MEGDFAKSRLLNSEPKGIEHEIGDTLVCCGKPSDYGDFRLRRGRGKCDRRECHENGDARFLIL